MINASLSSFIPYFPFFLPSSADLFPPTPLFISHFSSHLISSYLYLLFHCFLLYSPLLSYSSAQALCLSDEPKAVKEYRYPEKLPGELYDADTQCKWQFGEKAKLCTLDFKKVKLI